MPEPALAFATSSDTVIALGNESGWLALFHFGDELRPEAAAMVSLLRVEGRKLALLTGDAAPVAFRVAKALGIDEVEAGASPQGKHDYVSRLQANGAIVAMVGDGINDAPVLAQAQVSVAMGGGSQLARTQADSSSCYRKTSIIFARVFLLLHVVPCGSSGKPGVVFCTTSWRFHWRCSG